MKNKLSESLEQKNSKTLWRYNKSKRQDGNGVSPLKENDQLHSDSRRKAEILNNQFCSVFTSEDTTNIPKLTGPPNTEMPKFEITFQGVTKLLEGLNGGKASGPNELQNLILKNAATKYLPFLKLFSTNLYRRANYRPISLTFFCAKLLKHIICKQIFGKQNFNTCTAWLSIKTLMRKPAFDYN